MIGTPGRLEELLQKKTADINVGKAIKQLVGYSVVARYMLWEPWLGVL